MSNKIAAIIPVRGGSKGIKNKNLQQIEGASLIEWTVRQLIDSQSTIEIYASSNCEEILSHAADAGAKPILRPDNISGDVASSESAVIHCLEHIENLPDLVIFPQVTSPFRPTDCFDKALAQFAKESLDSMLSVVASDYFIWQSEPAPHAINYDPSNRPMRQQRTPEWIENGSFYIFKAKEFLEHRNRLFGKIGMFEMHGLGARIDINNHEDLYLARLFAEKEAASRSLGCESL